MKCKYQILWKCESQFSVYLSIQEDEYIECETNTRGGALVCAALVSGELSDGTTIVVQFETYDLPGSAASGMHLRL